MLARLLIALFVSLPLSAGAATFDPCEQLARQFKLAAENRDKGVPITKSVTELIYEDDEAVSLVKAFAWIYEEKAYSPIFFEEAARNTCNAS